MKTSKPNKSIKTVGSDDRETIKPKKKMSNDNTKVDLKSKKFWKEIYDDEGEDIEKYIR